MRLAGGKLANQKLVTTASKQHSQASIMLAWATYDTTKEKKMATAKQKLGIAAIITTADQLAEQHSAYTEQFVTRANEELYKLLGGMMALCLEVQANKCCDQIIKQMRKTLREQYQVNTQAKSTTASIVVRYVVRTGRKTAHVYGRTIQTAIDAGVTADQLPDYIRSNGGIDAIRQKGVAATAASNAIGASIINRAIERMTDDEKPAIQPILGTVAFSDGRNNVGLLHDRLRYTFLICEKVGREEPLQVVGIAYPTPTVETLIMRDYLNVMGIAAKQETSDFWKICKEAGVDMDTVISWRKANGIQTPADVVKRLSGLGLQFDAATTAGIYKAVEDRKLYDENHARHMEELTQAMKLKHGSGDAAVKQKEPPAPPKLKLAA
jgi:hypothetical protein